MLPVTSAQTTPVLNPALFPPSINNEVMLQPNALTLRRCCCTTANGGGDLRRKVAATEGGTVHPAGACSSGITVQHSGQSLGDAASAYLHNCAHQTTWRNPLTTHLTAPMVVQWAGCVSASMLALAIRAVGGGLMYMSHDVYGNIN
jgi:hypothetical protein